MDANAYSAGMAAGAAGTRSYYSQYLDYKNAFEDMKADRDRWMAYNEKLQRDYDQLFQTAQTLAVVLKKEVKSHPLSQKDNVNDLFQGKKQPKDFGVNLEVDAR